MNMREFLQVTKAPEREALAQAANTSVGYFWLIAGGHRKPSPGLCRRLVDAEPRLTLGGLRPDVWPELADKAEAG